jgi:predicted nucleic acid-binding protein
LAVATKIREHAAEGLLLRRTVDWTAALAEARRLAEAHTAATGCRTLDLLHIAIARQWDCTEFLSLDDRQLRTAKAAGLAVVDPRCVSAPKPRRETR